MGVKTCRCIGGEGGEKSGDGSYCQLTSCYCCGLQGDEWEEKWGEWWASMGRANKWADKWAKSGTNVWHEKWGEEYDGEGGCVKFTDKVQSGSMLFSFLSLWFLLSLFSVTSALWGLDRSFNLEYSQSLPQ